MSLAVIEKHADIVVPDSTKLAKPKWLITRRGGVGGSDAAAVLGLAPESWGSRYGVWADKTGLIPAVELDSDPVKWGTRLEEAIGLGFAEDTGIEVMRYRPMLRSKEWPWMMVNLDFVTKDGLAVVEVKNVGHFMGDEWENDQVPVWYYVQVQHEMAVTGLQAAWIAVLIGGQDPRYIRVERADVFIEDMVAQEKEFWDLVDSMTPPEVDGSKATTKALAAQYPKPVEGSIIELDTEAMALLAMRANLKADAKTVGTELVAVENELRAILADAETGTYNGQTVVTYKQVNKKAYEVKASSHRQFYTPSQKKESK